MQFSGRTRQNIELNIAPLIDVVFLLLIFFMLTSSMIKDQAIEISLPSSSSSNSVKETPITVYIKTDGSVYFNSSKVDLVELQKRLSESLLSKPELPIVLKSDNDLEVQKLISVMDIIKESGGSNISIATKEEINSSK